METDTRKFVPIRVAAAKFGVPLSWLKGEVEADRVPSVLAGRQRLVHLLTVERALLEQSGIGPDTLTDELVRAVAKFYKVKPDESLRSQARKSVAGAVRMAAEQLGCEPEQVPPLDVARIIERAIANFTTGNVPAPKRKRAKR